MGSHSNSSARKQLVFFAWTLIVEACVKGCSIIIRNNCDSKITACSQRKPDPILQYDLIPGGFQDLHLAPNCSWGYGVVYASVTGKCADDLHPSVPTDLNLTNHAEFRITNLTVGYYRLSVVEAYSIGMKIDVNVQPKGYLCGSVSCVIKNLSEFCQPPNELARHASGASCVNNQGRNEKPTYGTKQFKKACNTSVTYINDFNGTGFSCASLQTTYQVTFCPERYQIGLPETSLPNSGPLNSMPLDVSKGTVGILFGSILTVIVLVGGFFIFLSKNKIWVARGDDILLGEDIPKSSKEFSYATVRSITNNFATVIGRGGYGPVYYGRLPNGEEVAVKTNASNSKQGGYEFRNEVSLLSRLHHRNLVSLVGYCCEQPHQILIYVYMAQGTLSDHLYSRGGDIQTIDWKIRLSIALNTAKGLEYLHTGCNPPIIHRDVKASNILLDKKFDAKVGDFGISKLVPEEDIGGVSTAVKGTIGYLDPEYFMRRKLTTKSDVYSFGMVLLELITKKKPQSAEFPGTDISNISDWVRETLTAHNISAIVDPVLQGGYIEEGLLKVTRLALSCAQHKAADRPEMGEVVRVLAEALKLEAAFGSQI